VRMVRHAAELSTSAKPSFHCDSEFEPFRLVAKAAGFRSVQTTPLFTSGGGHLIGMVSTHFAHVHQPTKIEMETLSAYSLHAADFLEALLKGASLSSKAAEMHAKLWAEFELEALDVQNRKPRTRRRASLTDHRLSTCRRMVYLGWRAALGCPLPP
jgi:hypothetical protein